MSKTYEPVAIIREGRPSSSRPWEMLLTSRVNGKRSLDWQHFGTYKSKETAEAAARKNGFAIEYA